MRRKLSPWGWAAAGAVSVLLALWAGTTVYTALKQRSDEKRITRIERVVIGLSGHKKLGTGRSPNPSKSIQGSGQLGGDALQTGSTGHQQPGPSTGGHGNSGGVGGGGREPHPSHGGSGGPSGPAGGGSSPAPAPPSNQGGGQRSSVPPPVAEEHADHPLPEGAGKAVESIGASVGGVVKETGEGVNSGVEGVGKGAGEATCGSLLAPGCSK